MPKEVIIPEGATRPLAPYSPGTRAGNVVYVSGMVARDSAGNTIGQGDVKVQTRAVLDAIKAVVESAGGSMADIAFNTVIIKSLDDYKAMNEAYLEYFPSEPPARYCITAGLVRDDFLVEIASVAHI